MKARSLQGESLMSASSPTSFSDFPRVLLNEQRSLVRKGVAWLNANRHREDSEIIEGWLTREIASLDETSKLLASGPPAAEAVNEWLETAGRVGGPEREQDPTRPHPDAWHGNATADEVPASELQVSRR